MNRTLQEFFCVAVPKVSGAAAQLGLNILLLRFFGPARFGMVAVCLGMVLLADAVLGAAFDVAVLRLAPLYLDTERTHSLQVQQAGLLMKLLFGIAVGIPLVFFGPRLSVLLFQGRGSSDLLYLTASAVVALLVLRSVQAYFQVSSRFRAYGLLDVGHNTLRYGGVACLLFLHAATPARVLCFYAASPALISSILLATLARPMSAVPFSRRAFREVLTLITAYLPTAAVGSTATRADLFCVSSLVGVADAGIFAAAQVMVLAPQLIGMYMGVVFAPRIMPLYESGKLGPVYYRFQKYAIGACCLIFLLAIPTLTKFTAVFLPPSFRSSAPVAMILLPAGLAAIVNFPWTVSLLLFTKPLFLLKFDLVALPVLLVSYWFAIRGSGLSGAAAVTAGYALIKTVVIQKLARDVLAEKRSALSALEFGVVKTDLHLVDKTS
jgi:O-antigen/teichoic acid export membrane protein